MWEVRTTILPFAQAPWMEKEYNQNYIYTNIYTNIQDHLPDNLKYQFPFLPYPPT